jgi:regulatory protein YycI of two-component signal transduction system YycFG
MNWSKTKTVLIIGFLLLDLYLAYLLFYLPGVGAIQTTVTNADLEALVILSQHYNVDLAARPKPMTVQPLPLLAISEVSLDEATAESLAERWLGEDAQVEYQNNALLAQPVHHTRQEAIVAANEFLTAYLGEAAMLNYQVNLAIAAPDSESEYIVEFSRTYKGVPVFVDSYCLSVQSGLVVSFTAKQAQIGEAERTQLPLVSADQVVRRYLARLSVPQAEPITVLDLSLGYGVDLDSSEQQELEPVWRFYVIGGEENEVSIPAAHVYWESHGE